MDQYKDNLLNKATPVYCSFEEIPYVLTAEDIAHVLGIGLSGAYELLRSGELRSRRVGSRGQFRVSKDELRRYLNNIPN